MKTKVEKRTLLEAEGWKEDQPGFWQTKRSPEWEGYSLDGAYRLTVARKQSSERARLRKAGIKHLFGRLGHVYISKDGAALGYTRQEAIAYLDRVEAKCRT